MAEGAQSVTDRRLRLIDEWTEAGNWKQALKECEKWQKKGEKSDRFLATRAFVLINQPDKALRDRGQTEALQLARRKPPVTDRIAFDQLQDVLEDLSLLDEANELWDRAISLSQDTDLAMELLNRAVAHSAWVNGQKATMSLRKHNPKDRQYDFWDIIMRFLVYKESPIEEKGRNLHGALAYRMLENAAKAVSHDQAAPPTLGKSIATPEELHLLIEIYLKTGHAAEAVDILLDPRFGADSLIGSADPGLRYTLLLRALRESRRWDTAFLECRHLLELDPLSADNRVWDLLFDAAENSDSQKKAEVEDFLRVPLRKDGPSKRAAYIGLFRYTSKYRPIGLTNAELLEYCKSYHRDYRDGRFIAREVLGVLRSLDVEHQNAFKLFLMNDSPSGATAGITNYIFDYCVRQTPTNIEDLLYRARLGVENYVLNLPDATNATTCLLMAVLDLVRSKIVQGDLEYLLRALFILEICREQRPDSFYICVSLCECYLYLGLGSLAMSTYATLSIKNLQMESAAHLLLTRIGTIHPHECAGGSGASGSIDPAANLAYGIEVLDRSVVSMGKSIKNGFTNGSYSNIIDSIETRARLKSSINRCIFMLEHNRIGRNQCRLPDYIPEALTAGWSDSRDVSFYPGFVDDDLKIHTYLHSGPKQNNLYATAMIFVDDVTNYLKLDLEGIIDKAQTLYDRAKKTTISDVSSSALREQLTTAELRLLHNAICLWKLIIWVKEGDRSQPEVVAQYVKALEESLIAETLHFKHATGQWETKYKSGRMVRGIKVPVAEYLHESYCLIELCQTIISFIDWARKQGKPKAGKSKINFDEAGDSQLLKLLTALHSTCTNSHNIGAESNGNDSQEAQAVANTDTNLQIKAEVKNEKIPILDEERMLDWAREAENLYVEIRESALQINESLEQEGIFYRLVDVAFARGEEVDNKAIDEENRKWQDIMDGMCKEEKTIDVVTELCHKIVGSWKDAVGGLLQIELKPKGKGKGRK